jgi:hypothetical protein
MFKLIAAGAIAASGMALAGPFGTHEDDQKDAESQRPALTLLQEQVQGLRAHYASDGRIDRLYGKIFETGTSAKDTAQRFIASQAGIWGLDAEDLRPGGVLPSGAVVQPMMHDPSTGSPRFEGVYYSQWAGVYPVFESRLLVLTLNRADHGAVLAGADLRDLRNFTPTRPAAALTGVARLTGLSRTLLGTDEAFVASDPRVVVFAGYDHNPTEPTMAVEFVAQAGGFWEPSAYQKRRYVVRADDGLVLHDENMILSCMATDMPLGAMAIAAAGTVTGQVRGNTTAGTAADACDPEFVTGLPYARVTANGTTVYADASGNFTHPYSGGSTSFGGSLGGEFFSINNEAGSTTSASANGGSGDLVNITYNSSPSELVTAQTNAYLESNRVRDMVLTYNPTFPTINNQTNWPVNVNINDSCNAFYDYSSINFYQQGGSCNNTAFSVIVHHEYGHHCVAVAGSGQGEYGEGMGDVLGVVITGDSKLARGFYSNDCNNGIRNADNLCQFSASSCSSCGSAIHACGQLISGCVWDTWRALELSSPLNAQAIISSLSVNSMLLHSGTSINNAIAVDYVTLDDNDGNIDNGSPHYFEIAEGFGMHGLNVPEIALLSITAPDGLPNYIAPNGSTSIRIAIANLQGQFEEGSGRMFVGQGGSYDQVDLNPLGNEYEAIFPLSDCGDEVEYFFSASTTSGTNIYWPSDAPSVAFSVQSAYGEPIVAFSEDFGTAGDFSASGTADDGQWTHGTPVNCDRGDPPTDFDGNNSCWLTDNSSASSCNSDVDNGTVYVTSPAMDATAPGLSLCYARWFSNDSGGSPNTDTFVVEVSDDNGATWLPLETVGPGGSEVSGNWYDVCFVLDSVAGFTPTNQMRVRFSTSDGSADGSVVEAAIDALSLAAADCEDDNPCTGDLDGSGQVDVDDILAAIGSYGSGAGGDVDGDGDTDVDDLLLIVGAFGPCV